MLTIFTGRIGDHNDHAMTGAAQLGARLAERWSLAARCVGTPAPALNADWHTELIAASGPLDELARATRAAGRSGERLLTVMPRCAGALATVPMIAEQRPDVCVVWFDAHADLHLPTTTSSGYLGGMALSGAMGWWDSGFGAGLGDAVLAGTRDIDLAEQQLIDTHRISVVAPGPGFPERLLEALGGRPVYVHLDCDVLEPGIVPTDYRVAQGLDLTDLQSAVRALGDLDVVGLELAELQSESDGSAPDLDPLLTALSPLILVTSS